MAFLDKTGLQNLTNKLVQGDAIKVASHRGKNVKEVIDNIQRECENVALPNTMTLENRISKFKVGQGRDVDVSGDVEEGKIEVELQGKTYQNLLGTLKGTPSGINATNTVIDNGNKTITITRSVEPVNTHVGVYFDLNKSCLKENQTYTIIINVIENTLPNGMYLVDSSYTGFTPSKTISSNQTGIIRCSATYTGTGANRWWIWTLIDTKFGKVTFSYPILLEGDYTQTPIEELPKYFEGIKSSFEEGIVAVEVTGKNLFDKKTITVDKSLNNSGSSYENVGCNISDFIEVESNSSYVKSDTALYCEYDKDKNFIARYGNTTIVTSANCKYIRLNIISSKLENYQLEKGKIATPYEPYYKKKISFNIGEPLRSLPNGVRDEIKGNELIRRVGKIDLIGEEFWGVYHFENVNDTSTQTTGFFLPINNIKKIYNGGNLLSDKFGYLASLWDSSADFEGINTDSNNNGRLILRILKTKLKTQDINGFKQWLQQNPTAVYYELAEPIITPIEPIEFDVKPLATMIINSEIAPISKHKVVLNRAGQIEQGIQLIADLRNRINTLESIYDSNLIATQYKLDNLKLNYELEREED